MTRQNSLPVLPDDATANGTNTAAAVQPALIPLWDMANHCEGRITNVFSAAERRVEGAALRPFQRGDQIFIYYGARRNSDFLVHNGFVFRDNANDGCVVRLGLSANDALLVQRQQLLQRLSIAAHTELCVLPAPHFISGEMLAFVRVFNMNAAQLEHWLAADSNALDLMCVDCALETELEVRSWRFLQVRLQLLLRAATDGGRSLEEDERLLAEAKAKRLGFVRTMLVQYRVLEKRLLGGALEYVSQRTKQ